MVSGCSSAPRYPGWYTISSSELRPVSAWSGGRASGCCPPDSRSSSSCCSRRCFIRSARASPSRPAPARLVDARAMTRKRITRRNFVRELGTGVAFTIVPRHVIGRGLRPPSDKLNVVCIGVGGMGRNDVKGMEGENIYALCDVDWKAAEDAFQAYPKAKRYKDYREMLDKESKSIDAVTVSTPDHSHTAAGLLAMKAGKHTYIQKPLARTMGEVRV